jgi:GT2 family glycosyltransferase
VDTSKSLAPESAPADGIAVSFIIASWNGWHYLDPCLRSVIDGGCDRIEIIVVDNASTDGTPTLLKSKYPQAVLLANKRNEGHTRAINQGIAVARGRYLMVLDADTVLDPDAVSRLVDFLNQHPEAALAAPRMLNPDGSIQETARSFPNVVNGILGRQSTLTRFFSNTGFVKRYMRRDQIASRVPFEVDWVSAACMIFPRSLPDRIGLWDEGFKGYWVDADWCRAAHAAGTVWCVPGARVIHFEQNRVGRKKGANRILSFHSGAYRFYRKLHQVGVLHPRSIAAASVLYLRALALLAVDVLRRQDSPVYWTPRLTKNDRRETARNSTSPL